jgi:hypothetical protein
MVGPAELVLESLIIALANSKGPFLVAEVAFKLIPRATPCAEHRVICVHGGKIGLQKAPLFGSGAPSSADSSAANGNCNRCNAQRLDSGIPIHVS